MRTAAIWVFLGLVVWLTLPLRMSGQSEATYKSQCSNCHGMDGGGSTTAAKKMKVTDLRSRQVQSLSDEELFATIAYGLKHKQYPHAFLRRGLEQKQIADLVAYIRKLPGKR